MQFTLILLMCVSMGVITASLGLGSVQRQYLERQKECLKRISKSEDEFLALPPDNEDSRCMMACILEPMFTNGNLDMDKLTRHADDLVKELNPNVTLSENYPSKRQERDRVTKDCVDKANEKGKNNCEIVNDFFTCLHEYTSETLQNDVQ